MIAQLAVVLTLALVSLPQPVALSAFSLSTFSAIVGCETICMDWISPFLSAAILGFFLSILSFVVPLSPLQTFLLDVLLSALVALVYAYKFLKDELEGVAETLVSLLILASVGLAYLSPEAATQAMLSLTGSLWTVDPQAAIMLVLATIVIMILGSLFKNQLAAAMFDHEYLKIVGARLLFWSWVLFFFLVLGTSYASFSVGLLASQVLILLPAALSIEAGLRELETSFEATYSVALASTLFGCWVSYLWGIPGVGVAGMLLIILIVSLYLSKRIGKRDLRFIGFRRERGTKGLKQQEAPSQAVGKS